MRTSRWTAVVLGVLLVAGLHTTPASAHQVSGEGWTYRSDGPCTYQWAGLSHGEGKVGTSARVDSAERLVVPETIRCMRSKTVPPGYLRIAMVLLKDLGGGKEAACRFVPYAMNDKNQDSLLISEVYNDALCGAGSYRVGSDAAVLSNNEWHGGVMYSSHHNLGAGRFGASAESAVSAPLTPAPGPRVLPLVGADGELVRDSRGAVVFVRLDSNPGEAPLVLLSADPVAKAAFAAASAGTRVPG